MATSDYDDTVHIKCPESMITCQICMDIFDSPRILPCQHTFCKKCIVSLMKKHCLKKDGSMKIESSFPCPNCRRECKIQRNGKHSIESQLECCFKENLLLKQLLESVEERPVNKKGKAWVDIDIDELPTVVNKRQMQDQYTDKKHISMPLTYVIEERLWFYYLFMSELVVFLESCKTSLRTFKRPSLLTCFKNLLKVPDIILNPTLQRNRKSMRAEYMDINNTLRKIQMIEKDFSKIYPRIMLYERLDKQIETRDMETQTDNSIFMILILNGILSLLIYDKSPVIRLLQYFRADVPLDVNKLPIRNYMDKYESEKWFINVSCKLFEVVTLTYLTEQSSTIILLLIMCTLIYLILKLISEYTYVDKTLRKMPNIFLISLNMLTSIFRGHIYGVIVLNPNIWSLTTLLCCDISHCFVFYSFFRLLNMQRHVLND